MTCFHSPTSIKTASALFAALIFAGCSILSKNSTEKTTGANETNFARTDLSKKIQASPKLRPEDLGSPMRSYRGLGGTVFVPNKDGKTYDVIIHYIKNYWGPHTLTSFDLGTGKTYIKKYENVLTNWNHLGTNNKHLQCRWRQDRGL